jgi:hypothetical protein
MLRLLSFKCFLLKYFTFILSIDKIVVQSIKKERTHELNSKFDKTYQIFFKILSLFDIRRKSQFI